MNTNLTLLEIFSILIIHWIADFVLQTDEQAKGKSNNWNDLLSHTASHSICWLAFVICYTIIVSPDMHINGKLFLLVPITFICHTATDYYTSRVNSQLYKDGKMHQFFVSIGFDQILHYVQLFTTYALLKN